MTVWMICVHAGGARVFQCRSLSEGVHFHRSFNGTLSETVRDLESEAERERSPALILAAEEPLLGAFLSQLGSSTREKVIGTVTEDLFEANESDLIHYVDDFIEPNGTIAHGTTVFPSVEAETPTDDRDEVWTDDGATDDSVEQEDIERDVGLRTEPADPARTRADRIG